MSLMTGPIVLLVSGDRPSLSALTPLRAFAEALGREVRIVQRVPRTAQDVLLPKYVEQLRALLPDTAKSVSVQAVRPDELRSLLHEIDAAGGGIVAVTPNRRGGISRLLQPNYEERVLLDGPLPVLTLLRNSDAPIQRVLFPVDLAPRSEKLFAEAVTFCTRLGAELHLLHVFGDDRRLPAEMDTERRAAASTPRELYDIDKGQVQALVARAAAEGVAAVAATAEGRAHQQITTYAQKHPIDLIIMATHGPRSTADILFGTTTAHVMRSARVPVLAAYT